MWWKSGVVLAYHTGRPCRQTEEFIELDSPGGIVFRLIKQKWQVNGGRSGVAGSGVGENLGVKNKKESAALINI